MVYAVAFLSEMNRKDEIDVLNTINAKFLAAAKLHPNGRDEDRKIAIQFLKGALDGCRMHYPQPDKEYEECGIKEYIAFSIERGPEIIQSKTPITNEARNNLEIYPDGLAERLLLGSIDHYLKLVKQSCF